MGTSDNKVLIPADMYERILKKIEGTEFTSVSDYVLYVLKEVLGEEPPSHTYSKEDEEKIESRLRSLGYV
jgi:Arc/MetJ-type ribon-helix-helix transcriptional regulator